MDIRFYYAAGANCCERIKWALDYKGIAYTQLNEGTMSAADAEHFIRISPFQRWPVLELDGKPLSESMAMLEWLEEWQPLPPLNYRDLMLRARVREASEVVNSSIHPVQNRAVVRFFHPFGPEQEMRLMRADWVANNLAKLAPLLWLDSSFAVGEQFTMADILVAVIYRKGVQLGMLELPDLDLDLDDFAHHWAHLMSIDAVRASCPLAEAKTAG
ncbi:MAG: hypothetical protein RL748_1820 [Pseudomonadota bacterium]|jgi:glutathione S-transferase